MTKWLFPAACVGVLLWGAVAFSKQTRFDTTRDSTLAADTEHGKADDQLVDSSHAILAEADSLKRVADYWRSRARPVHPLPVAPDTTLADSVRYWRGVAAVRGDSLADALLALHNDSVAYLSLEGAFVRQRAAYALLDTVLSHERARVETLRALIAKTPNPCKRLPLLGIPVPTLGIGYGATLTGGVVRTGPTVAVGMSLTGGC